MGSEMCIRDRMCLACSGNSANYLCMVLLLNSSYSCELGQLALWSAEYKILNLESRISTGHSEDSQLSCQCFFACSGKSANYLCIVCRSLLSSLEQVSSKEIFHSYWQGLDKLKLGLHVISQLF